VVRVLKRFKPITTDNYNSSYSHTSLHIICVSTAHCKHGDELTQCMSYKENKLKSQWAFLKCICIYCLLKLLLQEMRIIRKPQVCLYFHFRSNHLTDAYLYVWALFFYLLRSLIKTILEIYLKWCKTDSMTCDSIVCQNSCTW